MKLALFNTIDETIAILQKNKEVYVSIEKELKYSLLSFLNREQALDITTRIKTAASLKEKIIRNHYYLKYDKAQEIIENLSDLIGLKIDCRFIEEEEQLYDSIKKEFSIQRDDGFYTSEKFPHIFFDLNAQQPQIQKNGFTIYRVDGYYHTEMHQIRFELQIKSLVNSLWGDIEHRLVYKNSSYIIYDSLMKDLLTSIKSNLEVIDRQLNIIYRNNLDAENHVSSGFVDTMSFERLMSKAINDLCAEKLRNAFGFTINIRETSDILGHYIFRKNIQSASADDQINNLLELFGKLNGEEIDFENEIEMELNLKSDCPFISLLGNRLLLEMNEDFDWFVFFKILFAIEPGNNIEDFILFLNVYRRYLVDDGYFKYTFDRLNEKDANQIRTSCLTMLASALCNIGDIQIVHNSKIDETKKVFVSFIQELEERVIDYSDFHHYESSYSEELETKIKDVFK